MSRAKLREHLLEMCASAGTAFLDAEVDSTQLLADGLATSISVAGRPNEPLVARMTTLASGAAAGHFLLYEGSAPLVAAQTAYGIEAEVRRHACW